MYRIFRKIFGIGVFVTLISVIFPGCNSNPSSPGQTIKFSKDILPIFVNNCAQASCHNASNRAGDLDYTSWESIMLEGSPAGAELIPFSAFWSHTIHHINYDTTISNLDEPKMPIYFPPYSNGQLLPLDKIKLIARWVDEGAQNDNGEIAYSNIRNKAFITNQAADLICVVDLDNNHVVRMFKAGERNPATQPLAAPHVCIVDNQGKYVYVSLIAEGYIEKYDAYTYQKLGRMAAGFSPAQIVISNDGLIGYYSNFDLTQSEKCIKRFDTQTMTILDTINEFRMNAAHGLRLTHDNHYLIGTTETSEYVYVINTKGDTIEDVIGVDNTVPPNGNGTGNFVPYQVAITHDDRYAFISCLRSNDVRILDIQNRVILPQHIAVGLNPLALEISPDGNWCYVPNRNSNSVTVIDVHTMNVVKTISNVGYQPHMIDFTGDGRYAYVTCESQSGSFIHHPTQGSKKPGTTTVINVLNDHSVVTNVEMASFPAGISITPGIGN